MYLSSHYSTLRLKHVFMPSFWTGPLKNYFKRSVISSLLDIKNEVSHDRKALLVLELLPKSFTWGMGEETLNYIKEFFGSPEQHVATKL